MTLTISRPKTLGARKGIVLSIIYALIVLAIGSFLYVVLLYPLESIQNAMDISPMNESAYFDTTNATIHNVWIWLPIIGIFVPVLIWLYVRAQEEGRGGTVYTGGL